MRVGLVSALALSVVGMFQATGSRALELEAQVLGLDGELYRVWSGSYGELFDDGQYPPESSALAVDVSTQAGGTTRRLVPGTGGSANESHPAVVFDDASQTLFLLWQSGSGEGGRSLNFVDLPAGGGFSRPIVLLHDQQGFDSTPLLAASRSDFEISDATAPSGYRRVMRTVLHLLWSQGDETEQERLYYTPIVILGSEGLAAGQPLAPADLSVPGVNPEGAAAIPSTLARQPDIDQGADSQSFVLTLADRSSGRLLTVRIRAVAGEIGLLADKARELLTGSGLKAGLIALGASESEQIEQQIVAAARNLHPGVAAYVGRSVRGVVDEFGLGPAAVEKARHVIIGIGSRTGGAGVLDDAASHATVEVPVHTAISPEPVTTVVEVAILADRPLPGGIGEGARAFSSPTGSSAVVLWNEVGAVAFRFADGDEWGPVHRLAAADATELESIVLSLRERVRRR
jgi:hypothetical protein